MVFCFFKQKTAYEMRISDWSSDLCSSDLNGTVNAYVLNDRVVWSGPREGLRYSLFSATVVVSDSEQPDRDTLGKQEPLRRLPPIGERQLPHGDGLPPPSRPFLDGIEPDLPATEQQNLDRSEERREG